jgi:hypothetical protein
LTKNAKTAASAAGSKKADRQADKEVIVNGEAEMTMTNGDGHHDANEMEEGLAEST